MGRNARRSGSHTHLTPPAVIVPQKISFFASIEVGSKKCPV